MATERELTIGMMCETRNVSRLKTACAAFSKANDASFFYFVPEDVNLEDKTIHGQTLSMGEWVTRTFEYPDVIHDCVARRGKFHDEVYEGLASIPMTTDKPFKVGDKMQVYRKIESDGRFADLLIPSVQVTNMEQIRLWLDRYQGIILKPVRGMQGKRVFCVKQTQTGFTVIKDRETIHLTESKLEKWLQTEGMADNIRYLIQPLICSETQDGNPFDIRAHMARGKNGDWQIVRIYPRVGPRTSITSNFSTGGYLADLDHFCELDLGMPNIRDFKRKLSKLALTFAPHMEKLLKYGLHQLAMDMGLDANGKLWLFEVNFNRIGVNFQEVEIARHAIDYAIHLARTHAVQQTKRMDQSRQLIFA
ncbi:YheC/YheD family protein [Paenibacillus hexagrammi]|uniref:YheC/YheD family protein n=1 Tax=Paenibacillus hexagrammi TaxID=2908839 RepID=A0ABY3SGD2_9BACL|nr:YheC/YheD family protein [Paenibacillus sp. YPD9-1]UJF32256.1 YheC/YheD family protein [Paenibacillus sp. YPD9-1]